MDIAESCKHNLRNYDESGWDNANLAIFKDFAKNFTISKLAAVLIPLFFKNDKMHVILTQRSHNVATHKGHISFPGGKAEKKDSNLEETALRETNEEIGIPVEDIEVISNLWMPTIVKERDHRFMQVQPIVAILKPGFKTKIDDNEVAEIFDVPLDFFLQSETHVVQYHNTNDNKFAVHCYEYYDQSKQSLFYIWGMTANLCLKTAVIALKKLPNFELDSALEQTLYHGFIKGQKPKRIFNSKI